MRTVAFGRALSAFATATLITASLAAPANAATFSSISRSPSSPVPSASAVTDTLSVGGATTTQTIGCITVEYSTSGTGSGHIPGFDASTATGASSLFTGLTVTKTTDVVTMKPATAAVPSSASGTFTIGNLTNGSTANSTYYVIVKTFTDAACSTLQDNGLAGFTYTASAVVTAAIAPTMTFTVASSGSACSLQSGLADSVYGAPASATAMDLGTINETKIGSSAHTLAVGTNANGGVTVKLRGANSSNNLRNGTVQPFVDSASAPVKGTATFSYTVSNTHSGLNSTWKALSNVDTEIGYSASQGFTGQCVGFSAAAASGSPAGNYAANVFYTAVPTF